MKAMVFGGTGFLGSHLCEALLKNGYEVTVYTRGKNFIKNVKYIYGDFSRESDFSSIIRGYDVIFHLVSCSVPSVYVPFEEIENVIKPTIRLLEACTEVGAKKIVYFSSGGTVYGIPECVPIDESHNTFPISMYGVHKLLIEKYLEYFSVNKGLKYTILRISNPYGRFEYSFVNQGLIPNLISKIFCNKAVEIWGDGSVIRDYIYVEDVATAAVRAIGYCGNYNIFNVGSGKGHSVNDILMIIKNILGINVQVSYLEGRKQDVPVNILDIGLISSEMEWKPKIELRDGIIKMINFWNPNTKRFDK